MKKIYVGMVAVFFVALATVVFAVPSAPGPGAAGPGWSCPGMFHGQNPAGCFPGGFSSRLNLSKEQTDKMRAIHDRFDAQTRDLRYDLEQKRLEARRLFTDPKSDDAAILAKQKEVTGLRSKLMESRAQMMLESRKVLTPEQLARLDSMPGRGGHRGFNRGQCWR